MSLLFSIILIGFITWLLTWAIPMSAKIAQLVQIVALIWCVLLVLQFFGFSLPLRVPSL